MAINSDRSVEELLSDGRYGDAASAARASGDPLRAAELFERIWDFASAADCAREAGDLARALKNAIEARDERLVGELRAALIAEGDEGKGRAANVFSTVRRFGDAAILAEELGDRERAIELYKSAHRDLDAARLLADAGRDREAGRLLERAIEHGDSDPDLAEAHLRLGLILARRMQHEEAVRHLQEAAAREETRPRAHRALVLELAALGLRDAARDVLVKARRESPAIPIDLEEFLRRERPSVTRRDSGDEGAQIVAGRYRLDELIGSGGSGRVYSAHDEVSGRTVALKMFHTAYARGTPAFERFVREARIASSLQHPNLVEVYSFSADLGFLVMELMPGGSLRDKLPTPLAGAALRRMALDVLGGLELAHQRGIIHRDVKPANIFFDARGTAKLGDFGVAHLLDLGQTQTGGLIGTLAYMSPEQITGAPLTIAADLYALGVTLFEALTGRLPFLGPDFVAQHLGEEPPALSAIADVSSSWDRIVATLLSKNPSERFESVDALRRAIAAIALEEDARPRPLAIPRAQPLEPGDAQPPAQDAVSPKPPAEQDAPADQPRYQFETTIGRTPISILSRALDRALDRSVILERYREDMSDEAAERRLYAMSRASGPFLQRVLAYDRAERVAVFEAPSGRPLSEVSESEPFLPRRAVRLLQRLARAVATLHEAGGAHGRIEPSTILVDGAFIPTVLVCGLGPADEAAAPEHDVAAILGLVGSRLGCAPTAEGVLEALAPGLSHPEKAAILAAGEPRTGAELFAFAEAVEIAMLKAAWRDRKGPRAGEDRPEDSVP